MNNNTLHATLTLCTDDDCILSWKDRTIFWKETWIIYGESVQDIENKIKTILKEIQVVPIENKENKVKMMQIVIKELLKALKKHNTECYFGGNWWGEYIIYDSYSGIIVE